MPQRKWIALIIALFSTAPFVIAEETKTRDATSFKPTREVIYKEIGELKLRMFIFEPKNHQPEDSRPAIVFIHGGGWSMGAPIAHYSQAAYFASRGLVTFSIEYRLYGKNKAQITDCIEDARSAIRWVRAHAQELGIDPNRIAASGGSAGGHLSAAAATIDAFDRASEDKTISATPNALILFNPALDLNYQAWKGSQVGANPNHEIFKRIGSEPDEVSPTLHITPKTPPTIIFHGKADKTVPYAQVIAFDKKMRESKRPCKLIGYEGKGHGFYNYRFTNDFIETVREADTFLADLHYTQGPPTVEAFIKPQSSTTPTPVAKKSKYHANMAYEPTRKVVYKKVNDTELKLHIFEPADHKPDQSRPAIVFFFGGGWSHGSPIQFYPQSAYLASRGMVAIAAEYRIHSKHKARITDCIEDARSAIRYVRQNAKMLGIDPDDIVASGGSAGGHLAASTATIDEFDLASEDKNISATPNAIILFNPVLDLTEKGYGKKFKSAKSRAFLDRLGADPQAVSPTLHITDKTVPALILHGKADTTVPYAQVVAFEEEMKKKERTCKLVGYDGQPHGFFNFSRPAKAHFIKTVKEADAFLVELNYLKGEQQLKTFLNE